MFFNVFCIPLIPNKLGDFYFGHTYCNTFVSQMSSRSKGIEGMTVIFLHVAQE
jgi:hypothetical protein